MAKAQKSRRFGTKLWQLQNWHTDKGSAENDAKWIAKHDASVRVKVVSGRGFKGDRKYYIYTRPLKWDKE